MITSIKTLIKQIFLAFLYLSRIREFRRPQLKFGINKSKKAFVIGNGPSTKQLFDKFHKGEIEIPHDCFFVNFAPVDDTFYEIKPNHYFVSDFSFSRPDHRKADVIRKMYERLQKEVDWDLTIYVTRYTKKQCQQLVDYSNINNPHIHFAFLYKRHCEDFEPSIRNRMFKTGFFMPVESTVITTALWEAILEGYSEIELYGVESNQFKDLTVSDDNTLYINSNHFYEIEKRPVIIDSTGEKCKTHIYLGTLCGQLRSHYFIRLFADYMGVKIYNCTPNSMIDSYVRKQKL